MDLPGQYDPTRSGAAWPSAAAPYATGTVKAIPDGDTIAVRTRDGRRLRVRLLGIDAPEMNYRGRGQGWWARAALHKLQGLCPVGAAVALATDRERLDKYGRLLAYVSRGGRNLNLAMVAAGWAVPYQIAPNLSLLDAMRQAAEGAFARGLGVHDPRQPLPMLPYEFRWHADGRAPDKFCGDAETRRYVPPPSFRGVPLARRVFFQTEADARRFGYLPAGAAAEMAAMMAWRADPSFGAGAGTAPPPRGGWNAPLL